MTTLEVLENYYKFIHHDVYIIIDYTTCINNTKRISTYLMFLNGVHKITTKTV